MLWERWGWGSGGGGGSGEGRGGCEGIIEWREGKDGKGEMYWILDFGRIYLGWISVNARILD